LVCGTVLANSLRGGSEDARVVTGAAVGLLVSGVVFLYRQILSDKPVAEWSLFRNASFAGAAVYVLCNNLIMYTTTLMVPFFVKDLRGGSSFTAGALLFALSALMALAAPIGGRVSDSAGRRFPVLLGGALTAGTLVVLLLVIRADTPIVVMAIALASMGFGLGLGLGSAPAAAIEAVQLDRSGAAAGTNFMMRWLGAVIGVAFLGSVLNSDKASEEIGPFTLVIAVMTGAAFLATFSGALISGRSRGWRSWRSPETVVLSASDEPVL
jgi:DHA2 family methylenomycin A resistance protein-like MFS transporter